MCAVAPLTEMCAEGSVPGGTLRLREDDVESLGFAAQGAGETGSGAGPGFHALRGTRPRSG